MSPKSTTDELGTLREIVFERDQYSCQWPSCSYPIDEWTNPLEMAHLVHRGMGGSRERNVPSNCVCLCRLHHSVFDGRSGLLKFRLELAAMLRDAAGLA